MARKKRFVEEVPFGLPDRLKGRLDEMGREVPDPTPVALPVRLRAGVSMVDEVRQAIRQELSQAAEAAGDESFEEADDFEVDDDPMPYSRFEHDAELEGLPPFRREVLDRQVEADVQAELKRRKHDHVGDDRGPGRGAAAPVGWPDGHEGQRQHRGGPGDAQHGADKAEGDSAPVK